MTNEEREAVALFRYGLIAPILNSYCDRQAYLQEICARIRKLSEQHYQPSLIQV